jgi:hypothetical protein
MALLPRFREYVESAVFECNVRRGVLVFSSPLTQLLEYAFRIDIDALRRDGLIRLGVCNRPR